MEHNPSLTPAYLAGKVDEYVKYQARDTIKRNAARDRNCRYARIPDGGACDFCRMLGSRGFVYHSEAKAGGDDQYHPFCNCQIAVCFDPFIEEYYVGWTKVTRGYGDGELARLGRDGSYELRAVDIDELYAEYKAMARDFNKSGKSSRYKDYTRGARLTDEAFDAAMKRLSEARTLDELHEAGADIVDNWPKNANGRDKSQWDEMSRHAQELERQLNSKQSGAVSGAVRGDRVKELEHAESYYEQVRNRNREKVLEKLGKESGLSPDEINRAFNHLLIEEHELDDGIHRFYPDYEISQSLQRLLDGEKIQPHDRIMFSHEYLESIYMEQGFDQRTAHEMANLKYNYEQALTEWLDAGAKV